MNVSFLLRDLSVSTRGSGGPSTSYGGHARRESREPGFEPLICHVPEARRRRTMTIVALEPPVGFLHDSSEYRTKQSLVYDPQEPSRWLGDVTTIETFGLGVLDLPSFYFTEDDYRYNLDIEVKHRFIEVLRERFNSDPRYNEHSLKWDTVIEQKTIEVARYAIGKSRSLDVSGPKPELDQRDSPELRRHIPPLCRSDRIETTRGDS